MSNLRQRGTKGQANASSSTDHVIEKMNGHNSHRHNPPLSVSSSFLHSHSHGDDEDGDDAEEHTGEAMMLLDALRGHGDAASRVTLMGLAANVGLTVLKGAAGWYLNSAALIADAGHSLSDLIADFVTLSTILLSQRPPSPLYPLGYGKFESLGTVTVSIFLLLGGIGIGAHSWGMLTETLASKLSASPSMPPFLVHIISYLAPSEDTSNQDYGHPHHAPFPTDGESLSPAAVLFPLFGILVKEYLYRVTKYVADEQNSSVLMANALHHRSDAYSSIVTVVAILGSLVLKDVPFDPMGGILVGILILLSSVRIFKGAVFELTDASVSTSTLQSYRNTLEQLPKTHIAGIDHVRAVRSGSSVFMDVDVTLHSRVSARDILEAIESIKAKITEERKEVKEEGIVRRSRSKLNAYFLNRTVYTISVQAKVLDCVDVECRVNVGAGPILLDNKTSAPMSKSPPREPPDVVVSSPPTPGAILMASIEGPTTEIPLEGLSRRQHDDQATAAPSITLVSDRKGKGKARAVDPIDELENYDLQEEADAVRMESTHEHNVFRDDNGAADYAEDSAGEASSGNGAYPPIGDDDLEERRVTETLKRWEEAERQRRKALRESSRSSNSHRNSLLGDVGRRANMLWKEGAQRRTSLRKGAMRLRDDESPTRRTSTGTRASGATRRSGGDDDNGGNGSSAPSRSTTLSIQERERPRSTSPSSPTPLVSNNPFSTPRIGSPTSFEDRSTSADEYASRSKSPTDGPEDALMEGTSNPPTPAVDRSTRRDQTNVDPEYADRPILQASGSYSLDTLSEKTAGNGRRSKNSLPPPPRSLDLPEEVIASPTAATTVPARTVSPMLIERSEAEVVEDDELEAREATQGRWWTDWLCGCRESGRLGQDQAGRTNPFE